MAAPMQGMSAGPPQHPGQLPGGHIAPNPAAATEVKFDNVVKVKALVWSLKEALATLVHVAADNISHTSAVDNGMRPSSKEEATLKRLDKTLEDFFSVCNQIELNLRTIQECALQLRDSHQYLPVPVVASKSEPCSPQDGALSYGQYIATVRAQVNFAKAIQDVLSEGARKLVQGEG